MRIKDMTRDQLNAYHRSKQRGYREAKARIRLERKLAGLDPILPAYKRPSRICSRCKQELPNTPAYFHSGNTCKKCDAKRSRAAKLMKAYKLTPEEYDALFKGAVCAICGDSERLVLDHCHELDILRGILCNPCNTMLGMARDDVHVLEAAIMYLRK